MSKEIGSDSFGSFEKLRQVCPDNMVQGKKEDEGYGYLPDIDISVQGEESNAACHSVIVLARSLRIELDTVRYLASEGQDHLPRRTEPVDHPLAAGAGRDYSGR